MWILMILGIVLMTVGGIWLLVIAFKQSVTWGLVVFFIPFAWLVFAIKYWQVAKTSFIVSLVGVVVFSGVYYGEVRPKIERNLLALERIQALRAHSAERQSGTTSSLDEAPMDESTPTDTRTDNAAGSTGSPATPQQPTAGTPSNAPPGDHTAPQDRHVPTRPRVIRVADAKDHIGELMRIYSVNHVVRQARLSAVHPTTLVFERDLSGGSLTFSMRLKDISRLETLGGANRQ